MALVAVSLVSLLALAALAVDVVTLYVARGDVERAADAAALAAAKALADSGVTTDPSDSTGIWNTACTLATQRATALAANQNLAQTPTVNVTFQGGSGFTPTCPAACTPGSACTFGINPQVAVSVTEGGLPTFFARIWGGATNSAGATAVAEAYNPSNSTVAISGGSTTIVPNAPRCAKPLLLPNCDPNSSAGASNCNASAYGPFVNATTGAISNPGGVIGDNFLLKSNCGGGSSPCLPGAPQVTAGSPPTLYYYLLSLPLSAEGQFCPGCWTPTGADFGGNLACCNYGRLQCGQSVSLDTTDNQPDGSSSSAATIAGQCLIHGSGQAYAANCTSPLDQDCLDTTKTPFVMEAGSFLVGKTTGTAISAGDPVMSSDSVVSLPIYDSTNGAPHGPGYSATIIGFLQAFVNNVDDNGFFTVTVLNVTGCGNSTSLEPVIGAGETVPVRLIHSP
jgi:hypothetical protein